MIKSNERILASSSAVFRCVKIPEFLTTSEAMQAYSKLNEFLAFDNKKAIEYSNLLELTEVLFSITNLSHTAKLHDLILNETDAFTVQKNVELKYKTSTFIDRTPKQMGNHTEVSRTEKANDEQVDTKIGILQKYRNWLTENKNKLINMATENVFDYEYNDMFTVSEIKQKFSTDDLKSITTINTILTNKHELPNLNVYHEITQELLQIAKQHLYNTTFLIKLSGLNVLEVEDFLNHQLNFSGNRKKFIQYVKYAALNSEIITHLGTKQAIQDWLNSKETLTKQTNKTEIQFEEFFTESIDQHTVQQLKEKFAESKGKELAILIYLIQTDFKIVDIIPSSKNKARSHFIKALTNDANFKMQGVNKYFISGTDNTQVDTKDPLFIQTKQYLESILK